MTTFDVSTTLFTGLNRQVAPEKRKGRPQDSILGAFHIDNAIDFERIGVLCSNKDSLRKLDEGQRKDLRMQHDNEATQRNTVRYTPNNGLIVLP